MWEARPSSAQLSVLRHHQLSIEKNKEIEGV